MLDFRFIFLVFMLIEKMFFGFDEWILNWMLFLVIWFFFMEKSFVFFLVFLEIVIVCWLVVVEVWCCKCIVWELVLFDRFWLNVVVRWGDFGLLFDIDWDCVCFWWGFFICKILMLVWFWILFLILDKRVK